MLNKLKTAITNINTNSELRAVVLLVMSMFSMCCLIAALISCQGCAERKVNNITINYYMPSDGCDGCSEWVDENNHA